MNILMILIVVISIVVMLFGAIMLYVYAMFMKSLQETYINLRNKLKSALGYDEGEWSYTFKRMKNNVKENEEKIKKLYELDVIKSALKAKELEELQRAKDKTEREIERLTK